MRLVTSSNVETITGKLDSYTGYYLRVNRSKTGKYVIYSCRKRGYVPRDGHWRFILMCAELAYTGLYATDIIVDFKELYWALYEAGHFIAAQCLYRGHTFHARDIINLKITFGL